MPIAATFEVARGTTFVQFDQPLGVVGAFEATTFVTRVSPNDRNTANVTLDGPDTVAIETVAAGAYGGSPIVNYDASLSTIVSAGGVPASSFEDFPCSVIT